MSVQAGPQLIETAFRDAWETSKNNFVTMIANTALLLVAFPFCVLTVVGIFFIPAFLGGYIKSMLDLARGRQVLIGAFFSDRIHRFGSLFGAYFLRMIAVSIGFALLIVPGIYLMIRWYFVIYALVDTDISVSEAFDRSTAITRDRWWDVFSLVILVTLVGWLVNATIIGMFVSMPFVTLVYAHYYLNSQ